MKRPVNLSKQENGEKYIQNFKRKSEGRNNVNSPRYKVEYNFNIYIKNMSYFL